MNRKDESNYRKIIVIDRRVCFTGGLNTLKNYSVILAHLGLRMAATVTMADSLAVFIR